MLCPLIGLGLRHPVARALEVFARGIGNGAAHSFITLIAMSPQNTDNCGKRRLRCDAPAKFAAVGPNAVLSRVQIQNEEQRYSLP